MEAIGTGEESPLPRSRHRERPAGVIGAPRQAHRADIPVAPYRRKRRNRLDSEGNRGGLRQAARRARNSYRNRSGWFRAAGRQRNVLVLGVPLGLNEAVTPLGRPDADKLTLLLKPFNGVTVIVLAPAAPCTIVTLLGEEEREKLGCGATAAVTDTLSKVAVASEEGLRLLTASPTYTFGAMLTVWLAPNCSQFATSAELYIVNTFPLLVSLIQYGQVPLPNDCYELLAPVLVRSVMYRVAE